MKLCLKYFLVRNYLVQPVWRQTQRSIVYSCFSIKKQTNSGDFLRLTVPVSQISSLVSAAKKTNPNSKWNFVVTFHQIQHITMPCTIYTFPQIPINSSQLDNIWYPNPHSVYLSGDRQGPNVIGFECSNHQNWIFYSPFRFFCMRIRLNSYL